MFFLVILLVVVLQHIYLYIFYNNPIDITENKEVFSYNIICTCFYPNLLFYMSTVVTENIIF